MSEPLDVGRLRADTPGSGSVAHLNNAGAALPPAVVVESMVAHLHREAEVGGYEAAAEASVRLGAVRSSVAALIGGRADQVALVESASEAWSRAFQSIWFTRTFGPRDRILVSSAEYASNVLPILQVARRSGARVEFIPDDEHGCVDVTACADMLGPDVALVAVTECPSQNGLVNDVAGVGAILRGSAAWYVVDGCQSVGQIPVDVAVIGADFYTATGRKWLRGPRGTGFLHASDRALAELEPFPLDLHSATWLADGYEVQPGGRGYEYWEKSPAAVLGLGAAIDYALLCGVDALADRIAALAVRMRAELSEIPGVTVRDRGLRRSGIVTFTHDDIPAAMLVAAIKAAGINVSLSTADYARHDFEAHGLAGVVRASPHAYNTEDEVDALVRAVADATG